MRKAEIESVPLLGLYQAGMKWKAISAPLISFIGRRRKAAVLLLLRHHTPLLLAFVVPPHIVVLGANDKHEVPCHKHKQDIVSAAVEWLIVVSVGLLG
jgi:hypothetical protein